MKMSEASEFVQNNARYMADSPCTPYFVRFPTPYSSKVFFSNDTYDLVVQVFRFANTKRGREMSRPTTLAADGGNAAYANR